jgi:hypothetical protein
MGHPFRAAMILMVAGGACDLVNPQAPEAGDVFDGPGDRSP